MSSDRGVRPITISPFIVGNIPEEPHLCNLQVRFPVLFRSTKHSLAGYFLIQSL